MKAVFAVLLLGCLAVQNLSYAAEQASHNIEWGARSSRDVLLAREILTEKAKTLRIVSNDFAFVQRPDRFPTTRTITQIVVTDQYTNGNGGYATLKSGGPSMDHVTLHLKSQRGHGYSFIVDIYGQ